MSKNYIRNKKLKLFPDKKENVHQPPGTLIQRITGETAPETKIIVIEYDATSYNEVILDNIDDCTAFKHSKKIKWINVEGIHDTAIVKKIGEIFNIHALSLEDVISPDQRPKFESYDDYDMTFMKMLYEFDSKIYSEQLSIILKDNLVITFQELEGKDAFDPIRQRLKQENLKIRKFGADYLAYSLIDCIVDAYFIILEKIGERLEDLDEELIIKPTPETLQKLYYMKREMIALRKSIWPIRELISSIERSDSNLITKDTQLFFRDVYDHSLRVIETTESYRDLVAGMMDLYMSSMSNKMNEVMKVLTIISTIFIPVTFIAGVYGMNFKFMPELESPYGYAATWAVMLAIMISLLIYFRRKKWL
ncbi:MAG: magnesium/cobalt transporter CorA [Bacteroidota bacterium]